MSTLSRVVLLCFLLLVLDLVQAGKHGPKCNSTRDDEADTCMQKMFLIGDRTQRFRETIGQMRNYCKQILQLQTCVKRFSRECLPEMGRQVTSLLLYGVKKVNKQYCSSERGMIRFNEIAKCGNHELNHKHDCMDHFLNHLRLVEKRTDEGMVETRIHYVCCYFSQFQDCVDSTFNIGDSSKRCPNADVKQSVIDLIGGYADDALDMVCGEFGNNGQKCLELLETDEQKGDATDKEVDSKQHKDHKRHSKMRSKTAKSILPYFVNIFGKM